MKLIIEEREIIFNTQSTKAKKMTLEATPEGHITLKVPAKTTEAEILAFVKAHSKTILAFQDRVENRKYISSKKNYTEDETFLFQGKACQLGELLETIPETEEEIQLLLKKFYIAQTKVIVKKRVKHFEKLIGVNAKSITVVDSPCSWGTCNSYKELTFNYRLSMAPLQVIDYVVIHELCHIHHLNHDRSFWRKVGAYDPHFKEHQDYLARFGGVMTI